MLTPGLAGMTDTHLAPSLFAPARVGPLHLPNRLVMVPMTRNRATADGVPTPLMATYYAQRASAGLIIAEAATPNADVRGADRHRAIGTGEFGERHVQAVRLLGVDVRGARRHVQQ